MTRFADVPTDFSAFDDTLHPLAPDAALRYFLNLVPKLGVDPERWGERQERHAFTLAADTEGVILERVQAALADMLKTGEVKKGRADVDALLDEIGVSAKNPGYAENVIRTNLMDAYNTGATEEMQDPDVADYFPAWIFRGIRDGRQRHSHEVHFDHYFPNSVSFADVRDSVKGEFDGYRCRCGPQVVDRHEWADLRKRGAAFSAFAEKFCAPGTPEAKPGPCPEGEGGAAPSEKPKSPARVEYEKAHSAWEVRGEAREKSQAHLDATRAAMVTADAEVKAADEELGDVGGDEWMGTEKPADPERMKAALNGFVAVHATARDRALKALEASGATEKEMAPVRRAAEKAAAAVDKKAAAFAQQADKVHELRAVIDDAEPPEPETQPFDDSPFQHPDEPQEPPLPVPIVNTTADSGTAVRVPDWESDEQEAEYDRAYEKWDGEHDAWEATTEKIDAKKEKAEEKHDAAQEKIHDAWEKEHDAWEKKAEKKSERLDDERGKLEERYNDLFTTADDGKDDFEGKVYDAIDAVDGRLNDDEAADAEPDEPDEEEEPDEGGEDEPARHAERFCQEGTNKGKPGPCPDTAEPEIPAPASAASAKPKGRIRAALDRVKAAASAVGSYLDRRSDLPVVRQAKAVLGKATAAVKAAQAKLMEVAAKRYGKAGAAAIAGAALASNFAPGVPGWFAAIPGGSLLAQLPLMGLAEAVKQTGRAARAVGRKVGFDEQLDPRTLAGEARALRAKLAAAWFNALHAHRGTLAGALEGFEAHVEKFAGSLAGKPCGPGQSAARTGCTPKAKAAPKRPGGGRAVPKKPPAKPKAAPGPKAAPKKPPARKPPAKKPPAPKPAPAPPTFPPRAIPPATPAGGRAIEALRGHIDRQAHLSPGQKKSYGEAIDRVVRSMPDKAVARLAAGVKGVHWHADNGAVTEAWLKLAGPAGRAMLGAGGRVGGYYEMGTTKRLVLDGADLSPDSAPELRTSRIANVHSNYAHEMAHALDHDQSLSSHPDFVAAWKEEIRAGHETAPRLSAYGASSAIEGVAEFGRLLYGSDVPHDLIQKRFPKCSAFFVKQGLWKPDVARHAEGDAATGPLLPELFTWGGVLDGTVVDGWAPPAEKHAETAPVPPVVQQKSWSCGPAALKAAAARFGLDVPEPDLRRLLGADPDDGTPPPAMTAGAHRLLDAEARENWTDAQLWRALIQGFPVIACVQLHGGGHWIVYTGLRPGAVELMDTLDGKTRVVARRDLARVWKDEDAGGRKWVRFGILIRGCRP